MRHTLTAIVLLVLISSCGNSQSRATLASQTVTTYWTDINNAKIAQAYNLLTSGQRQAHPLSTYNQSMFGFLRSTHGVHVKTGKARVNGDYATVPLTLVAATGEKLPPPVYQHLYWENGHWRVSEENGGLTHQP